MCAEDIFAATEPVDDGYHHVDAVYQEKQHPFEVVGTADQLEEQEHLYVGNGDAAHVAGKAPGIVAEVEIQEHHDRHDYEYDEACEAEVDDVRIDVIE